MSALLAGLSFLGLALLLGGALARRWLTPGTPPRRVLGVGLGLLLLGWGGQVAATLSVLGLQTPDDLLAYLTTTGTGRSMLLGLSGALVLLVSELEDWPWLAGLGASAVTLWATAGIGHGAGHGPWIRGLHAAHAGAMCVWVGGVLALWLTRSGKPELARRFTPAALGSVLVLAATGLLMSGEHLQTLAEWTRSAYGQTLLLKLGLVGLTLVAAGLVRRAFARRGPVRPALARELAVLLTVLGVTAVLTTQAPPQEPGQPGHSHGP